MKKYSTSKLVLVVFVIVSLLSLPYTFAKKPTPPPPEPQEELSWTVYVPVGSNGIQGSGGITCQNDCPEALAPEGYQEYYVYESSETTNHDVLLQQSYSDRTVSRTIFRFQVLLGNQNLVRPSVMYEDALYCDPDYPIEIDCVMTQPQPSGNGFASISFAFDSDYGFDFNDQTIGGTEVLPISLFMAKNDRWIYYDEVVGYIEDEYDETLTVTRIDTDVWRIRYMSLNPDNLYVHMYDWERICELVRKRTVCSWELFEDEGNFILKNFDIYFVREQN